jgi:hypothetical protein
MLQHRWENNTVLGERRCKDRNLIELAHRRIQWEALMTAKYFCVIECKEFLDQLNNYPWLMNLTVT